MKAGSGLGWLVEEGNVGLLDQMVEVKMGMQEYGADSCAG